MAEEKKARACECCSITGILLALVGLITFLPLPKKPLLTGLLLLVGGVAIYIKSK